jgi:hypothetical protein
LYCIYRNEEEGIEKKYILSSIENELGCIENIEERRERIMGNKHKLEITV